MVKQMLNAPYREKSLITDLFYANTASHVSQNIIFKAFTDHCTWPLAYYAHSFREQTIEMINLVPPSTRLPSCFLATVSPTLHVTISSTVMEHLLNGRRLCKFSSIQNNTLSKEIQTSLVVTEHLKVSPANVNKSQVKAIWVKTEIVHLQ